MSQLISGIFYCGFFLVFIDFVKSFSSGGIGKNGSTIAVSDKTRCEEISNLYCRKTISKKKN